MSQTNAYIIVHRRVVDLHLSLGVRQRRLHSHHTYIIVRTPFRASIKELKLSGDLLLAGSACGRLSKPVFADCGQ